MGVLSTGERGSCVEEMALTTCFEEEMEEKKILSISGVECLGKDAKKDTQLHYVREGSCCRLFLRQL